MTTSAADLIGARHMLVVAHRGDSRVGPENTLPAFESAVRLGVDFVELDYRHSADDVPIVFHDEHLDRATDACRRWSGSKLPLAARSVAELHELDAGSWFSPRFAGTRLVTLAELLAALPTTCFMVERKSGSAERCVEVLRSQSAMGRVIVQAFDAEFLAACRRLAPEMILGALGSKQLGDALLARADELGCAVIGWEAASLGREEIDCIHAAGMKAWSWTVDEPDEARRLLAAGVDALISNRPGEIQAIVAGHSG